MVANARWAAALRIAAPEKRWKTVLEALNMVDRESMSATVELAETQLNRRMVHI